MCGKSNTRLVDKLDSQMKNEEANQNEHSLKMNDHSWYQILNNEQYQAALNYVSPSAQIRKEAVNQEEFATCDIVQLLLNYAFLNQKAQAKINCQEGANAIAADQIG